MRVVAVNPGSSTLKVSLVEGDRREREVASELHDDFDAALAAALAKLPEGRPDAAAVRVVHGGNLFGGPTLAESEETIDRIASLSPLAPLHQPSAVSALRALSRVLPRTPRVACFDTSFHRTLPPAAYRYAVPEPWYAEHGVRRYGFHGLSYAYVAGELPRLARARPSRVVALHLGSGASACALQDGVSVDTTMGLTPLEGLVMGTRPGVLDPGVVPYLVRRGMSAEDVERALEKRSGLLGLSGATGDYRALGESARDGDPKAALALEVFARRVASAVAQMAASLGGLDAVAYTGGIGEHAASLRADVAARLAFLGLAVDPERNAAKGDREISPAGARARTFVIEAMEDVTMAREAAAVLGA